MRPGCPPSSRGSHARPRSPRASGNCPEKEYEITQRFIRKEDDSRSIRGTTWFSQEACLGSINEETFWIQRRVVLGYWKTPEDKAVQLRLRFLCDGRDFVSAWASSRQQGTSVLTGVSFLVDHGDFHPVFYFPENSNFSAEDFRLRYELLGVGAKGRATGDGRFELSAGSLRALIQPLEGNSSARRSRGN